MLARSGSARPFIVADGSGTGVMGVTPEGVIGAVGGAGTAGPVGGGGTVGAGVGGAFWKATSAPRSI